MTQNLTLAAIREYGLFASFDTETREYRVNLPAYAGGTEATAYYTDDALDALGTAQRMALTSGVSVPNTAVLP